MLSNFSYTFWSSVGLLQRNVYLDFLPIFLSRFFVFWYLAVCMCAQWVSHVWPTLCDSMDSGSSVHKISQARILEWVAFSSSRGSSQPRDWTAFPALAGEFFTTKLHGKPWVRSSLYIWGVNPLLVAFSAILYIVFLLSLWFPLVCRRF